MTADAQPYVVVVEDEEGLADLYEKWLSESYAVDTAYGGPQAVELIDGSVDVVLLDRRMPELTGDEVLEELRNQELSCQIAMLTAVEPDFDLIEMPFDSYLVKPVSKADLKTAIDDLLERCSYSAETQELITLLTKRKLLETEKEDYELDESDAYAELCDHIEDLRERVDAPTEILG